MVAVVRVIAVALLLCWGSLTAAQTPPVSVDDPVFPFWNDVAVDAERTIDNADTATLDDLTALRARLVNFRNEFSNQREANADRIANLESQINALGPIPEGGVELPDIAEKRAELQEQLETLLAPVRVADVAYRRADGLIGEIDAALRERQTRQLLALGPSPIDPRTWPVAFADIGRMVSDMGSNLHTLSSQRTRETLKDRLPLILLLTIISATLMLNGRRWAGKLVDSLRRFGGRGSGVWSFLASILRILLPLIGVYIFTYAARLTGILSPKIDTMVGLLPVWGLILLGFYWLAERLFPRNEDEVIVSLSGDKRKLMRYYVLLLSVLFVVRGVLDVVFELEQAEPETLATVVFPIVVLTAMILFLVGAQLRKRATQEEETREQNSGLARAVRFVGTFMVGVSIVSPVMAAIGYAEAGNALLYPTVISVLLFGLLLVLQRFVADFYGLVTGQGSTARDGLPGIVIGFLLCVVALPLLMLIWGARVTDLQELWTNFLEGFDIGGTRVSPRSFLIFAIVFAIGYTITRVLQSILRQSVLPKTSLDLGGQNALVSGLGYIGIFLAALIGVTVAGLDLSGVALVAGALSVGIGFGLQTIVSNFISGIILLVERPISEGDWIEVGGQMGYVKNISVRSTRIETFDRTDVIVPNSDLISGTVTNYTRGNTIGRLIVKVGVAYGTDTKKVDGILREIAKSHPMVLSNPPPNVLFMGFGADSLDFEIRAILRDVNWVLSVQNDFNHAIAARFQEEGIEIPFAQRDIWLRNPEALQSRDKSHAVDVSEFGEEEPETDTDAVSNDGDGAGAQEGSAT